MGLMDWSEQGLRAAGFDGFLLFADSGGEVIPKGPGVYAVIRPTDRAPVFAESSPAGRFKGKDPAVPIAALESAWVNGARVIYIGKAAAGKSARRGLRKRLGEYRRHGQGDPVGHWGGRYIWQLVDHPRLIVAWRPTPNEDAEQLESTLISEFVADYGGRPFGNRKLGIKRVVDQLGNGQPICGVTVASTPRQP